MSFHRKTRLCRVPVSRSDARFGIAFLGALALLVSVVSVAWALGELTQKPGTAGCVAETVTGGECEDGKGLVLATDVAVSPDGKNVYVAGLAGIAIFDRDLVTGTLTQKPGQAGCISETGTGGECQNGKAISGPEAIAVSPDGENVYVAAEGSDAVAILDRHADQEGALTQKLTSTAGCISETGTRGECQDGKALKHPFGVAVSPGGENVYVASAESAAVTTFNRHADQEGALSQEQTGTAGCVSEDGTGGACQDGKALKAALGVAVSPDGENVYVSSLESDAVAIFNRHAGQEGALTQEQTGTAGCISETGTGGECEDGKALEVPVRVAVSPDGKDVYVAAAGSGVAILNRHADQEGALSQEQTGTAGCVSETGTGGACQNGKALLAVQGIAVSPDGTSVYAASFFSDAVSVLDRDQEGDLTQKPGKAACISEDGSGGECEDGKAIQSVDGVAVSSDGTSVYAAAFGSSAVSVFDRSTPATPPASHTTQTAFACNRPVVALGGAVHCTATVEDTAASGVSVPSGEVVFSDADRGSFSPSTCTLAKPGAGSGASCGVDFAPTRSGAHELTASYAGDAGHRGSQGTAQVQVGEAAAAAPNTRLKKKPRKRTARRMARFRFVSDQPGSSFQCKLDKRPLRRCRSPFKRRVKPGRHVFRVRAVNSQGIADPTPAVYRWKVRKAGALTQ